MTRDPVSAVHGAILPNSRVKRNFVFLNRQISGGISNHLFFAFSFITSTALLISGLGFFDSIVSTLALFTFAAPIYTLLKSKSTSSQRHQSEIPAIFFSLSISSIALALLFGFTPLSTQLWIFWVSSLLCVIAALFFGYRQHSIKTVLTRKGQNLTGFVSTSVLMFIASLYLRSTNPYDSLNPKWVPDDYPFFALVGRDTSIGSPGEAFFDGLSINYHWLTYSLFGGISRVTDTDFILGTLRIAPIFSWLLLCLGAILLAQMFSTRKISIVLATSSVMFSSALGVLIFSVPSLGGLFISPSTLVTASWMVALLVFVYSMTSRGNSPIFLIPLMLALGFSLALGKITTAAAALLGLVAIAGFQSTLGSKSRFSFRKFVTEQAFTSLPFAIGVVLASRLFLQSTETPITFDERLVQAQMSISANFLLTLIPVFAALFAVAVMVLPVFFSPSMIKKDALYFATAICSAVGLILIFALELPAGNEAWFLVAVLALALPLSSIAVVNFITDAIATMTKLKSIKISFAAILIIALPLLLLFFGNNEVFITRPWIVPSVLVGLSVCVGLSWQIRSWPTTIRATTQAVLPLMVAFLFLSSLIYGFALRTESAIMSNLVRSEVSQARDDWLASTRTKAMIARSEVGSSPIAIYSDSIGELALTRWIPYFLDTRAYTLGSLDELTDFYTPVEEVEKRQQWVTAYVRSQDPIACQELNAAGVRYIWITQGFDSSTTAQNTVSTPSLLPVRCS